MKLKFLLVIACTVAFIQIGFNAQGQSDLGEFCYYESVDGQKTESVAIPYLKNERIEIKFKSSYQITIKSSEKQLISDIAKNIKTDTKEKIKLGTYKPESISCSSKTGSKYSKIIDGSGELTFYFDGKNLIIDIPELHDIFDGNIGESHIIYIPSRCINDFQNCLK
jgi:hypothetical protein